MSDSAPAILVFETAIDLCRLDCSYTSDFNTEHAKWSGHVCYE